MSDGSTGPTRPDVPVRAWVLAAATVAVIVVAPSDGPLAWVAFVAASLLAAGAVLAVPGGFAFAAAALFVATGVREGLVVVEASSVHVFHVVLAGIGLAAAWRAVRDRRVPRLALSPLEGALLGPFLAGVWSLAASLDPPTTLLYSLRLALLWAAAIAVSRALASEGDRRRALVVFVIGAALLAAFAFVQRAMPDLVLGNVHRAGDALDGTMITRPAAFYLDPNFLGAHLALGALGALALAGRGRRAWWWLAPAALMLGGVAISYSRSAWVAIAVGLLALMVIGPRRLRLPLIGVVTAAIVAGMVVVGPGPLLARVESIVSVRSGSSNSTRLLMAESTLEMIADRPVFGTGLEAYDEAYPAYWKPGALRRVTHPHQVPLALVAETGIAGVAAQLALLASLAWAARRRYREGLTEADVGSLAGLLTVLVGSFLQYFLYFEPLWLLAGLLAAGARPMTAAAAPGEAA